MGGGGGTQVQSPHPKDYFPMLGDVFGHHVTPGM